MEWTIELTGPGLGKPTTFTFEQLAGMKMVRIDNVLMQKSHEPDEMTGWEGPSLDALLAVTQIKSGPMTLTLEAADGYVMNCTLADMESAIVALKDGKGRWLGEFDGTCLVRLVAPHKPGNYWIMNLRRIRVEPVTHAEPST